MRASSAPRCCASEGRGCSSSNRGTEVRTKPAAPRVRRTFREALGKSRSRVCVRGELSPGQVRLASHLVRAAITHAVIPCDRHVDDGRLHENVRQHCDGRRLRRRRNHRPERRTADRLRGRERLSAVKSPRQCTERSTTIQRSPATGAVGRFSVRRPMRQSPRPSAGCLPLDSRPY